MTPWPNTQTTGPLELVEVYEYYDEPLLFSCRAATDQRYLVVLSEDRDGERKWLFAPMSEKRYLMVRSGGLDLNAAFRRVEGDRLLQVTQQGRIEQEDWVLASEVTDAQLPSAGEELTRGALIARRGSYEPIVLARAVRLNTETKDG